jgi:signal transduction histidine kinase
MSIRTKLILSNFAMVIIPFCLFALSMILIVGIYMKDAAGIAGFYDNGAGTGKGDSGETRPIGKLKRTAQIRAELMSGLKFTGKYEPERLLDETFLRKMDEELGKLKAGFVVRQQGSTTHMSPTLADAELTAEWERIEQSGRAGHKPNVRGGDRRYLLEYEPLTFPGQEDGMLILVTDMSPITELMPQFIPVVAGTLLLVLIVTNGLLTLVVARSIIKPLNKLRRAAEQIKEGNLDHPAGLFRRDEIGQLSDTFEEMRVRLKQSIELQLQYEDNRKELLANISHDLKTPITAIKGCAEGVLDGIAVTPEKQANYMRMILKKASDMDRQIEELFLFSKLDLKRAPFLFERTDLVGYVRDYVEELRHDPANEHVLFTFDTAELKADKAVVMADKEKLHRVLQNIVDNSLKHMPAEQKDGRQSRIRIELKLTGVSAGREAEIKVTDNGNGIDGEALPHIFDKFYRADSSRNANTGGSGLGLAIVKQIVEEHGGRVWAESLPGEGTTVSFTLPAAKDQDQDGGGSSL